VEATVDLGGVRTWNAVDGARERLVYLHGGFSDADELDPVRERYAARFRVFTPDRRGHGRTPDVEGPLDFGRTAADTLASLESVVGGPADLVGYSDGATTGLHVALERPDLVRRLVMISGQLHHDGLLPGMFGDDPAVEAEEMVGTDLARRYAELSPDGPAHFRTVAEKVIRMAMTEPRLGVADLARVPARTLVVAGDDDVIPLEHTLALYRGLPDAELAVVPGTSHILILEKPALVAQLALEFLTTEPVPTRYPMRRR